MESPSGLTISANPATKLSSRSLRHYRQTIRGCTYVKLDSTDGGLLRNVNEFGIAMHAVGAFVPDQQIHLQFELANPRLRVETRGRVVWTDSLGRLGIEFLHLPERNRKSLQEWLLAQILASTERVSTSPLDDEAGLLFSPSARPAIRLELPKPSPTKGVPPSAAAPLAEAERVRLLWYPFPVSERTLARLLDGLVLLCGLLLFAVTAMTMTSEVPSWPLAIALALGAGSLFLGLYWLLFRYCTHTSPGQHLAHIAFTESAAHQPISDQPVRFR